MTEWLSAYSIIRAHKQVVRPLPLSTIARIDNLTDESIR
jgi:hypothetical protein